MKVVPNDEGQFTLHQLLTGDFDWDRTFRHQGYTYVVISKGDSLKTDLACDPKCVAIFNLKSRTIIGIARDTIVTPVNSTVYTETL